MASPATSGTCAIKPTIVGSRTTLNAVDISTIILYFVGVLGVAFVVAWRRRRATSVHYFLADRNSVWWAVGFSLFTSNIGTEHLVGLAGSGASRGLAVGVYEWTSGLELLVLGWLFVPFYLRSRVYTMPEFLGRRYDGRSQTIYAVICLLASCLTKLAPTLFAGSIVLYHTFGWHVYASAGVLSALVGVYTAAGGLAVVIYTEVLQTTVLCIGALSILFIGLNRVGGIEGLFNCPELVPRDFFQLFKPPSDPTFPWTGLLLAHPFTIGLWYWCSEQFIVQRVLSARNEEHAKRGTVLAGFFKILPLWTMVLPGLMARALYNQQMTESTNDAYALLVIDMLPRGMHGIMLAAMLSAMMSSLASEFNSVSTIVAVDIWGRWRPKTPQRSLVVIGRCAIVVMVLLSMLWIPFITLLSDSLYVYMNKIQSNLSPPIAAAFLWGILWKGTTPTAAFVSFCVGLSIGILRLCLEVYFMTHVASGFWVIFAAPTETTPGVNFLHFGVCNMLLCSAIILLVSRFTAPPDPERIKGMTFQTRHEVPDFRAPEAPEKAGRGAGGKAGAEVMTFERFDADGKVVELELPEKSAGGEGAPRGKESPKESLDAGDVEAGGLHPPSTGSSAHRRTPALRENTDSPHPHPLPPGGGGVGLRAPGEAGGAEGGQGEVAEEERTLGDEDRTPMVQHEDAEIAWPSWWPQPLRKASNTGAVVLIFALLLQFIIVSNWSYASEWRPPS